MAKDLSSDLLEEVFNEVDDLEKTTGVTKESSSSSSPAVVGFLEDVAKREVQQIFERRQPVRTKDPEENNPKLSKAADILERVQSLVHDGLTDSSDDEENKYFEEARYNRCGKDIKALMRDKSADESLSLDDRSRPKEKAFSSNARLAREKLQEHLDKIKGLGTEGSGSPVPTPTSTSSILVDPVLNMRIVNPLVSSTVLKEKMIGRISVSTMKIKTFLKTPSSKDVDWVTGGVITNKMVKTSQKGNQYCIWYLTDLCGDIKSISVFLFGSAYKEFWKLNAGTVVGILNPVPMDNNDRWEATLRVDNAHKILVMGSSKDYGICKSKKKNGDNCTSVVNLARCEFCCYHLQKEYTKACRRSDLQPPKINGNMSNLQKKVLGKSQVFAGGKIFTGVRGKKSSTNIEKDQKRLLALSQTSSPAPVKSSQVPGTNRAPVTSANFNRVLVSQPVRSGLQKIVTPAQASTCVVRTPTGPVRTTKTTTPTTPSSQMIDLDVPITKNDRSRAKTYALNFVRKNGPIKKVEDGVRGKRTPEQIASVKRKLDAEAEEQEASRKKVREGEGKDPAKEKLARVGMDSKFFELMNAEAADKLLLETAESDQREKYFNRLETREKLEDKMASTFKVDCNAVRCLKCNYKSFSAAELCKKEKHPLKVVKAVKRFWKCGKCSARTVCLELVPLHPCKTCGSSKWERTSLMPDKGPNLIVEPLSLRGLEEKFIGSVVKNANLNLLVPEQTS